MSKQEGGSMRKRLRACEECHRLKIKCDISTNPDAASCERCTRNNLECVPAAPRLQRNRIQELEAQIQELSNLLQKQSNNSPTPSRSPGGLSTNTLGRSPGSLTDNHYEAILSFLDARISLIQQQHLLQLYAHQAGSAWPVIRLPGDLEYLRTKAPILLLCIVAYTTTQEAQGLDLETHDEIIRESMHVLGEEVLGRGQRSLELVQALLIATYWNKLPRRGLMGSCYQILQLAADMAIDVGIAGNSLQPTPPAYFCRHQDAGSLEARRTWLACYMALSSSSISTRRPNSYPWNAYHEECLLYLESQGDASDMLLCQLVRITQLDQEISNQLYLCQIATFVDGNDYNTYAVIESMKNKLEAWVAHIPPSLATSQTLKVWWHAAMVHLYELVLHTPTNKASFAAPFIPGRIPVKDFPKPTIIIAPLKTSLEALVQNCHAVLDTAAEMDPALLVNFPSFCFAPTVIYSLFVLVTVMVASTDPANTYGQCLPNNCFRIEEFGLKMRNLVMYMKVLDPTLSCFTTRMFDATSWLEQWYNDYTAILQRYEANLVN
ncbi:uncharacterized protein J4E79_005799 [Alternaria viburni]|uniref:uncharacterized protein n=1 Tax=Alternaria viburni TaxID=566460 RepID=UPI0020C4FB6E|nr:uncharacterized protein J4E79_005799 [Alternaria viburni]KAI4659997.1 hypothetical protein J4E79_005799 [Alternaria viburni]